MAWSQVSASQIESFQKCKRSWFLKSVLRAPEPQRGAQALGESFHLVMEKVPKGLPWPGKDETGASEEEWDKAEQLAKIALPLLPADPGNKILREHGITMDTYPGGPLMKGYIDLAVPEGVGWEALLIPPTEAIVGDYKTLSDFRYMKTPEELANSVQMMIYAKWAISPGGLLLPVDDLTPTSAEEAELLQINSKRSVRLVHFYARTKPPFGRNSIRNESAIVTVPQINAFWDKTLDIVREMQQVSACGSFEDVTATGTLTGHCEAYGGCGFRDKCGIAGPSNIKGLFQIGKKPQTPSTPTGQDMSGSAILAKIQAARAAAAGQTVAQPTQPVAATSPAPTVQVEPTKTVETKPEPAQSTSVQASVSEPAAPKSAETAKASVGPVSGLLAKIKSTGHGLPRLAGAAAQQYNKETGMADETYPGSGMRAQTTINSLGELIKYASGIVPPDAPARTQDVITKPGDHVVDPLAEPAEGDEDGETGETGSDAGAAVDQGGASGTDAPGSAGTGPATTGAGVSGTVAGAVVSNVPSTGSTVKRGRPTKEEMARREAEEKAKFESAVAAEVAKRLAGGGHSLEGDLAATNALVSKLTKERDQALEATNANTDAYMVGIQLKGEIDKLKAENAQLTEIISKHNDEAIKQDASRAPAQGTGTTLYIDCFPVKGQREGTVDFFEWIQPIAAAVAQSNGVADYRLIQYNSKGLLATHIRELVKAEGLPRAMTIPSYAAGADVALEILTPLAKSVIRKLS